MADRADLGCSQKPSSSCSRRLQEQAATQPPTKEAGSSVLCVQEARELFTQNTSSSESSVKSPGSLKSPNTYSPPTPQSMAPSPSHHAPVGSPKVKYLSGPGLNWMMRFLMYLAAHSLA